MAKPFSLQFIMTLTHKHVIQQIDLSCRKTGERLQDIPDEQRREVLETLGQLELYKKMQNDFRFHNQHLFLED